MSHRFVTAAIAFIALASLAVAAEGKSGPEVGKVASAFTVKDVTGPKKGTSLCYRCAYEDRPVVCVFVRREVGAEVAGLVKQIDSAVGAHGDKELRAFVVLLTDDVDGGVKALAKVAEDNAIKHVPLTVFDGGAEGPRSYKISPDAAVTVLMWRKAKIAVNHAFGDAKLTDDEVKAVVVDVSKILD